MKDARNRKYTKDKTIFNLMVIMFFGSLFGSFALGFIGDESFQKINLFLSSFINNEQTLSSGNFFEVFLKSIKYFVFIWFLGFISFGYLYIYVIVFYKTFLTSFTTSLFFYKYGFSSIKYIYEIYMVNNLINIFIILLISYKAINYCKQKMLKKNNDFFAYIKMFILCIFLNLIFLIVYK